MYLYPSVGSIKQSIAYIGMVWWPVMLNHVCAEQSIIRFHSTIPKPVHSHSARKRIQNQQVKDQSVSATLTFPFQFLTPLWLIQRFDLSWTKPQLALELLHLPGWENIGIAKDAKITSVLTESKHYWEPFKPLWYCFWRWRVSRGTST